MFLTILFILLFLGGIALVLLKWKGSVSLVPLAFCLAGIVLVLYLNTGEKKKSQAEKKIHELNLIEYTDYISKTGKGLEVTKAVATANVNMRDDAGREGGIIRSVPSGAQVKIISPDHESGWFNASYDGNSGWIYGKYLKKTGIASRQVNTAQLSGNRSFRYVFPEKTVWGKLLGVLIGISISLYLAFMGYNDMLSSRRFGISWAYFMIKNIYIYIGNYPEQFSLGTFLTMLIATALVAFVLNALANLGLNLIDQYRIKAVSH